jgi:uncharacterized protein YbaR (Trm112 family)
MALESTLLQILVCPIDKSPLLYFEDEAILYNPRLHRAYRIESGIPMMLAEQARPIADEEHKRLVKRARCGEAAGTLGEPAKGIAATDGGSIS